jgi:biopolymer transport protein ExbD
MPLEVVCPTCGSRLAAIATGAQSEMHCRDCGAVVRVPKHEQGAQEQQQPPEAQDSPNHPPFTTPVKGHPEDLIDMTAMVDIVFFLLIFFLVTSMQSVESVIDLPSPQASNAATAAPATNYATDPTMITVSIEDDDSVWLNDEQVYGEQDLRSKLRSMRRQDEKLTGMMLIGSPEASHGVFVMVLDAAADAEITNLRFSVPQDNQTAIASR